MSFDKFLNFMNIHINIYDPDNKNEIINNYWYDIGCLEAQEILNTFSNNDWLELENKLPELGLHFKRNLAYCLEGNNTYNELIILFKLLEVGDEELTEICIDSLRDFDSDDIEKFIGKGDDLKTISDKLSARDGFDKMRDV